MSENETKICPYCAEVIQKAAIKCKHCQSMLVEGSVAKPHETPLASIAGSSTNVSISATKHEISRTRQKIVCAQCGSENVQRLSVAHAMGTSRSTSVGIAGGAGVMGGSGVGGVGLGIGTTKQQSEFAKAVRPPQVKVPSAQIALFITTTILVPIVLLVAILSRLTLSEAALGIGVVGGLPLFLIVFLYLIVRRDTGKAIKLHAEFEAAQKRDESLYRRTFVCLACGARTTSSE